MDDMVEMYKIFVAVVVGYMNTLFPTELRTEQLVQKDMYYFDVCPCQAFFVVAASSCV